MADEIAVAYNEESGMFEIGIPARDLTAEEWAQVPPDVQKRLLDQKIYKKIKQPVKKETE